MTDLITLTPTTNQEAFDMVVARFLDGRGQANATPVRGLLTVCRYRSEEGVPCAVGAMIPDEFYDPALEKHTLYSLVYGDASTPKRLDLHGLSVELLAALQDAHDVTSNWDGNTFVYWPEMRRIAHLHSLSTDRVPTDAE